MTPAGRPARISAVIPTFNRADLIIRAIDSALSQTRPPDEVIVVDDGSTDGTETEVLTRRPAVRYIRQPNSGAAAARNRGTREARGEWIAFLDSDDAWVEGHLRAIESAIESTGGQADLYFGDARRTEAEGGVSLWAEVQFAPRHPFDFLDDASDWVMLRRQPAMVQASVIRRSVLLELGGFDEGLTVREDTHLLLRLGLGRAACAVSAAGVRMTGEDTSGGRLTETHDPEHKVYWDCTVHLYEDALDHLPLRRQDDKEIRRRLSVAHLRLARIAVAERRSRVAGRELIAGVRLSPVTTAQAIAHRIGRVRPGARAGSPDGADPPS